jgi:hypothetical protein
MSVNGLPAAATVVSPVLNVREPDFTAVVKSDCVCTTVHETYPIANYPEAVSRAAATTFTERACNVHQIGEVSTAWECADGDLRAFAGSLRAEE